VLRVFLEGDSDLTLAAAAEQLGLSLAAVKSAVHRLRHRMGELVREDIRETVETPAEVEAELQQLFVALRG
jgi:DNA-directed RNA polymerase specialized sigma24 family protein